MPSIRVCWSIAKVGYLTLANYLVGLTPEEYHCAKASAWADVGWYRWAIWHYTKALKASEQSFTRAAVGWCYAQLGMPEAALEHYRKAYARSQHPSVVLGLAFAEYETGDLQSCRALIDRLRADGKLDAEHHAELARLEQLVLQAS